MNEQEYYYPPPGDPWQQQQEHLHQMWDPYELQARLKANSAVVPDQIRTYENRTRTQPRQGKKIMPKVSEMLTSKYLKKEDVGDGVLATVAGIEKINVAMENDAPEYKYCMSFQELEKPLVLNSTNIQLCAMAFESDDTEDWLGKKIVLYNDPNVSFAGKITGGIRVRKPRTAKPVETVKRRPIDEEMDDDIPF